ncbi:MAG: alpha/beta fold hydrolase, partial [Hymenobacteraceae bacterium]|nr:alpha/beta fold hydrolase [Hymenobacteraceae bacterium]MDX5394590.1 alpha/beta fold hydrolase [Hymenobacteraceae bacterium]MDX5510618.1 alpha/beta fold hydrolase [Hymenobacteraceae bacterium]
LVDMRNHGRSGHSHDFDYNLMAEDLLEFVNDHQLEQPYVIGHSMGGKAAMKFALQNPDKVGKLIVVDISPKAYPVHHDQIIKGLQAVDLASLENRQQADEQLARYVAEDDVRLFLLKNLYRTEDGGFGWRVNLKAIDENIDLIGAAIESDTPFRNPALFIRGAKSKYIKLEDQYEYIEHLFPNVEIETIQNAGHWVHAEAPDALYELVVKFLEQ